MHSVSLPFLPPSVCVHVYVCMCLGGLVGVCVRQRLPDQTLVSLSWVFLSTKIWPRSLPLLDLRSPGVARILLSHVGGNLSSLFSHLRACIQQESLEVCLARIPLLLSWWLLLVIFHLPMPVALLAYKYPLFLVEFPVEPSSIMNSFLLYCK